MALHGVQGSVATWPAKQLLTTSAVVAISCLAASVAAREVSVDGISTVGALFRSGRVTDIKSFLLRAAMLLQTAGWAGFLTFMATFSLWVCLALPTTPIEVAVGFVYGPLRGCLCGLVCKTAGSCVAFLIARCLGQRLGWKVPEVVREKLQLLHSQPFPTMVGIRLAPVPLGVKNFGLAFSDVDLVSYTAAAIAVNFPFSLLWASAGASCQSLSEAVSFDLSNQDGVRQLAIAVPTAVLLVIVTWLLVPKLQSLSALRLEVAADARVKVRSLIEDHFQVDEGFRVLGPLRQDRNLARQAHDWFNLVALVPVIWLNAVNWSLWAPAPNGLHGLRSGTTTLPQLWNGSCFEQFWWCTCVYFIVDLLWLVVLPNCVRSPASIVKHHIATLLYICVPKCMPEYGWLMGACMAVEVNTWLLIARRVSNADGVRPWFSVGVPFAKSMRIKVISIAFYITWFAIRLIVYPYLILITIQEWAKRSAQVGTHLNILAITPVLQTVFTALNLKWTADLLWSKLKSKGPAQGL